MIHLTYSNRTEALLDALVRRLHEERAERSPLEPLRVAVPNRNIERYAELGVARRLGIAANLRFPRLEELVNEWLGERERPLLLDNPLRARVLRALSDPDLLAHPTMGPVRRYLHGAGERPDAVERRRAQLAVHTSALFREYSLSRAELLDGWTMSRLSFAGGPHAHTEAWQSTLFRWMRDAPWAGDARTLSEALRATKAPHSWARPLHVFGVSYVAPIFSQFFDALGEHTELHLYALNPCEEFWEDIETEGELRRRRRGTSTEPEWFFEGEDPFRLHVDTEAPLLRAWGRPGREHVRLLDALTECDFDPRFVDPLPEAPAEVEGLPLFARAQETTLLEKMQHDILTRAPRRETPAGAHSDSSVTILACPGVRREVESVAAEIWSLVETLDDLSFTDIAVLVNGPDRDAYLPHVEAVFEEAHRIPFNVADLSLAASNPMVEGALRVLGLPASGFTRPDVLGVMTHPAVHGRVGDVGEEEWEALASRLGIFHGLDRSELEGTYVAAEDRLSWDQGITRVALGAFASAERDGEPRFVDLDGRLYLPEAAPVGSLIEARFALLARSLSSDVRFARASSLSLPQWASFASAMLSAYLTPTDEREESVLRRVRAVVSKLGELDLDGSKYRYSAVWELLRADIEALGGGRGQGLVDGVAISSLVPMRAIPFRVVFILGLGEGRFPAADRRDSMDLRAARRRAGDVTPPERDRYAFLETLLCARERLILSYVARDARTGDALAPSVVVSELLDAIEEGYLPGARGALVRRVPLRRDEEAAMCAVLPEAAAEHDARTLGRALRGALGKNEGRSLARLTTSEAARRVSRHSPELERALVLPPLPLGRSHELAPSLRVTFAALRRFLECPLQGWTRAVLRLDEGDLGSEAARSDEPFEPSRLDEVIVLRAAFAGAALTGEAAEDVHVRQLAALMASGRWPLGPLADLQRTQHSEILEAWAAAWSALDEAHGGARRLRFGASTADERGVEPRDPVVIFFDDDPRDPGCGAPLRVELVGATELLVGDPLSSASLHLRHRGGARGAVEELRHGLRAFLDQVALAASGHGGSHRAAQLYADRDTPVRLELGALAPEEARAWLKGVLADLLGRSHPYFFPIEAVLRLDGEVRGEEIVDSIELVRERWGGGQSRFGPVRDAVDRAPPPPGEAEIMAHQRYGLWLRRMTVRSEGGPR